MMHQIIQFLSKLRFWTFVLVFTILAIVLSEFLMIFQSYWLTGNFFTKDLFIVGFITPAIDAFIVFTIAAFLVQHLKELELEKGKLLSDLQEQKELLRSVIDENPDPVIVKNFEGKFVLVNKACATLYGSTVEEMIGKDDGDYIPDQELVKFFKRNVQEIMTKGEIQIVYEDSIDVESGERRNYKSVKIPYKTSTDKDQILVVAHDITKEKEREEELKFMNDALDKVSDAYFLIDKTGKILKTNLAASRDLLYTQDELISMYVHQISQNVVEEKWQEIFEEIKALGTLTRETSHRRKDGTTYEAEISISYIEHQGNEYQLVFSRDITDKKEQQKELEYRAHFDALTDLPNRLVLADRIEQAMGQSIRRENFLAAAYLDLDGFKEVNDRYGHNVGDALLKSLAIKMKQLLRQGDTIARIGGDEFVALLVDFTDKNDIKHFLDRLLKAISSPIEVEGNTVQVSASIGITFYPQTNELSADQLVRQADMAMYQAKKEGKNRYKFFTE